MDSHLIRRSSSAGIWIGALAWAASTQLNYSLVPWVCFSGIRITPWTAAVLALISLLGAALSGYAFRHRRERLETERPHAGTPHEMLAVLGMAIGVLFALVIIMQGLAGLFLTGCEK
jgi:hypothetical protein